MNLTGGSPWNPEVFVASLLQYSFILHALPSYWQMPLQQVFNLLSFVLLQGILHKKMKKYF